MKLNKPLIRKMIKRIETMPETYCQGDWMRRVTKHNAPHYKRPVPRCGTVACLAGEAVICSQPSVSKGLAALERSLTGEGKIVSELAAELMGIEGSHYYIFSATGRCWPQPYASRFMKAKSYKQEARVAVSLLKAILKTDGRILEG